MGAYLNRNCLQDVQTQRFLNPNSIIVQVIFLMDYNLGKKSFKNFCLARTSSYIFLVENNF